MTTPHKTIREFWAVECASPKGRTLARPPLGRIFEFDSRRDARAYAKRYNKWGKEAGFTLKYRAVRVRETREVSS